MRSAALVLVVGAVVRILDAGRAGAVAVDEVAAARRLDAIAAAEAVEDVGAAEGADAVALRRPLKEVRIAGAV